MKISTTRPGLDRRNTHFLGPPLCSAPHGQRIRAWQHGWPWPWPNEHGIHLDRAGIEPRRDAAANGVQWHHQLLLPWPCIKNRTTPISPLQPSTLRPPDTNPFAVCTRTTSQPAPASNRSSATTGPSSSPPFKITVPQESPSSQFITNVLPVHLFGPASWLSHEFIAYAASRQHHDSRRSQFCIFFYNLAASLLEPA